MFVHPVHAISVTYASSAKYVLQGFKQNPFGLAGLIFFRKLHFQVVTSRKISIKDLK